MHIFLFVFQETHKDSLRISFEDIRLATQNFNTKIGRGRHGNVYQGEVLGVNGPTPIAVKQYEENDDYDEDGEREFLTELEILFEYKHENIIGLIGYCNEDNKKFLVFEQAPYGGLNFHVDNDSLTWTERLKIGIDVAIGLDFLHGGDSPVIHRGINSNNILLNDDWKAKITDFGVSLIASINDEIDFVVDHAYGTPGYFDPKYRNDGFLTRESDIYSLGVVLCEMMCGRTAYSHINKDNLADLVKRHYEEGKVDELVFKGIKDQIVPKSMVAFLKIAYECLYDEREKRPKASEVVLQLKKALEFQEDIEIWEAKLPKDYKEIIHMSKNPKIYSNLSNKDLCEKFSKGILLQNGKTCLSVKVNGNGERSETVSATLFSYENNKLHNKRISISNSRFQRVVKMMDISDLKIQIKIKTQFLSPNVIYGAHLVFKFCDPRKFSSNLKYVNLKYKLGGEILHAYFATCGDDMWMMIELCRFIPHKKDIDFEVLLESLSRYYCGTGEIYVEGIHFQPINNTTLEPELYEKLEGVQEVLKSNLDYGQQVPVDYDEINRLDDDEKLLSVSKANEKNCHMLPAKMVLYESSDVKCFNWKSLAEPESRFLEVAELISHQVFQIRCKIEIQNLSPDTDYTCHLVFKLSQKCHGLHCPVRVRDVLNRKKKEFMFLYFRSPRLINLHGNEKVPKRREDGLMEVIMWEFNSGNNDHVPMSLKLRCYEGTMSGLIVYGVEFRPI
ncbi:putative protein kinase RLK-Pelle-LRR-I-1 family [Helianthus annuus]|uniref:Protein kinase domain-containing protein n=1 Tax=Helianthus annuus TaxID=4232 RepID=A0A9K3HT81_HELAN|nr:putative protein kinase RLK-Pelle-LRR-I-1 family [Helianthus annuus]KAJ0876892.1 putative protein kinase RLK-Pelle-LRR-I-1 family [Helianthus annuus]